MRALLVVHDLPAPRPISRHAPASDGSGAMLLALTTTVIAAELVRREVVAFKLERPRGWRIDAAAFGALYATIAAVALWILVALGADSESLREALLMVGVLFVLLLFNRVVVR